MRVSLESTSELSVKATNKGSCKYQKLEITVEAWLWKRQWKISLVINLAVPIRLGINLAVPVEEVPVFYTVYTSIWLTSATLNLLGWPKSTMTRAQASKLRASSLN